MVKYDLSHLTQDSKQEVCGPIQDDEALFLYSLIKCKLISRILEIGGLSGYSAKNFLEGIKGKADGIVYTVDINEVVSQSPNHKCIIKDASHLIFLACIPDRAITMMPAIQTRIDNMSKLQKAQYVRADKKLIKNDAYMTIQYLYIVLSEEHVHETI